MSELPLPPLCGKIFPVIEMEMPKRKRNRLKGYDYSRSGCYFLTICAKNKKCLFCDIVGGGALDAPQVKLTEIGTLTEKAIRSTNRIKGLAVESYVIMPNHIHILLWVTSPSGPSGAPAPTYGLVPRAVAVLKRLVNHEVGCDVFQRSYHDHIVRGEADHRKIREYIENNPAKWMEDCFYPGSFTEKEDF